MKIVCIEPDIILAKQYKKILSTGHMAYICLDGQAAIEVIDTHKIDVILMELQIAPHSGIAFINELKSYEDFAHIPIVIYSSVPKDSFKVSTKTWQSLGVRRYFYKSTDSIQKVATFISTLEVS